MPPLDFQGSSLQAVRKMKHRLPQFWTALSLALVLAGCYEDSTTEDSNLDSGDRTRMTATPHLRTLPQSGGATSAMGGTAPSSPAGGTRASKGGSESVIPAGGTGDSWSTQTSTGGASEVSSGGSGASTGGYAGGGASSGGDSFGGNSDGFAGNTISPDSVAGSAGSGQIAGNAGTTS